MSVIGLLHNRIMTTNKQEYLSLRRKPLFRRGKRGGGGKHSNGLIAYLGRVLIHLNCCMLTVNTFNLYRPRKNNLRNLFNSLTTEK